MSVTLQPNPIRGPKLGRGIVAAMSHNMIGHCLGEPCIHIHGLSRQAKAAGYKYPLNHWKNIVKNLTHESIHCIFSSTLLNENRNQVLDNGFDDVWLPRLDQVFREALRERCPGAEE